MRVFVAIEINDESTLQSIQDIQNELTIKAKPVAKQNLHFTLQFLGEVSEEVVEKIKSSLKTMVFPSFELEIIGVGAFPKPKMPRVIWVGTDQNGGNIMKDLAKNVEEVLKPLGFTQDKTFKPHLTIFRIKNKIGNITKELNQFKERKFGKITVSEINLKQSKLTPSGPIYSDLEVISAE